jgi:hypothetical protein
LPAAAEVAIIGAGYLAYALVRLAVRAGRHAAFVHAAELWRAERWLHLDVEPSLNHLASASPALAEATGYYYGLLHFIVTPLVLGWLYLGRRPAFPRLRSALVLATSAANIVFWTWPVAPPRYSVPGMTDILVSHHVLGAADPHGPGRLVNLYAAMPSLHVAWATWCTVAVITATRSRWRHLAWLYPSATVLVVLASANHFLLDVVGGLAVLGLGLLGTAGKQRRLRRSPGSRRPAGPGRPGRTADEHRHHHRPPGGRRRPGGSAAHRVRAGRRRRPRGNAGRDGPRPARARHHPRPAGRHLGRGPERRVPCLPPADRGHRRTLAAIWRGLRRSDILPLRPRMVGVWGLCGRGLTLSREPPRQRRRSGDSCVSRPGPVPGPLYTAILRHAVLVMAALAICAVTAALLKDRADTQAPPPVTPDQAPPAEPGMIPLTIVEISRLLAARLLQPHPPGHATHWLNWRRRHQARSRWYHQHAQLARDGGITLVS